MQSHSARWICSALLCLSACTALAQSQYTVKKVVFNGTMPYAETDMALASGIKPGDQITQDTMQQAAQRLSDTGAFGDIQVTLDGSVKAIDIIFKVKPVDTSRLLATSFDNFVWWTHDELFAELHHRVPLFNGSLPEAGTLQQSVTDALQQMLAEKQVTANIERRIYDASPGHPDRRIAYYVGSPGIFIGAIHLQGVTADQAPAVQKLVNAVAKTPYSDTIEGRILSPYRDAGYLDARLDGLTRTVSPAASGPISVDLSATVIPGEIYHFSTFDFAGTPILSADDFNSHARLHPGDLVSQKDLHASLSAIDTAYRRNGYLDVSIETKPKLDASTHTVAYTIVVNEGPQYRLHEVQVSGLSEASNKSFNEAWKLHPGDVYDNTYLPLFLKANVAQPYLQPYTVRYKEIRDPDTHDLVLEMMFDRAK